MKVYSILCDHICSSMTTYKWSLMSYYGHYLENLKKYHYFTSDHLRLKKKKKNFIDYKSAFNEIFRLQIISKSAKS